MTYLITGATGVVGSQLLKHVCQQSSAELILLVRGEDPTKRIQNLFQKISLDFENLKARISIIHSAAETPNFSLSNHDFMALAKRIDVVFHCAANVDLLQSPDVAMSQSLGAIENIIALLKHNANIKLEHVSTVGVNGQSPQGLEEKPITKHRSFFNSYEMSKAKVEERLYPLMNQFKITIHRPSMVIGEFHSGQILSFHIFYFLLRVIAGELSQGYLPPVLNRKLDTVPCDFVAKVLLLSSQNEKLNGQIIHTCSGPQKSLTLADLQKIYLDCKKVCGLPVANVHFIPTALVRFVAQLGRILPLSEQLKKRVQLIPQLLDYASHDQIFFNQLTQQNLSGLVWPDPRAYVQNSIAYYLTTKHKLELAGVTP